MRGIVTALTATQLQQQLQQGELSATAVTASFLERCRKLNQTYGAFTHLAAEQAYAAAERQDAERAANPNQALPAMWGMPIAHKDLVDVAGQPTTHGSRAFNNIATTDDPLVAQLRLAGTIALGKTQVPEFGLTGYSDNLIAQPARNPFNPALTAGGSSGGAAVAVATGMAPFAVGSDAGGSIRIPAACCGLYGLKPGRNRLAVDRKPDAPDPHLAVQGPLAKNPADATLLFTAMLDSSERAMFQHQMQQPVRPLKIGFTLESPFTAELNIQVANEQQAATSQTGEQLCALGHRVQEFHPNYLPGYFAAFANYWRHSFSRQNFSDEQIELFTAYTRYSYDEGRKLGVDQAAAAIAKLQQIAAHATSVWSNFDVVITPILAFSPPRAGYFETLHPEENWRLQCEWLPFTSLVNVTGHPALAVPVTGTGLENGDGMPASLQLIGKPGSEALLLQLAEQLRG